MTTSSQRSTLPDLRGQVCLVADASSPVGRAVHRQLLAAGAGVIALHHDDRAVRRPEPFRPGVDTFAALVDLTDPTEVAAALTWAVKRTQRVDVAVLTSRPGGAAVAALAARQLGITAHFQPDHVPALLYLARPSERADAMLETALETAAVFADPIEVVVVDAWPDTPRSTVSAVGQLLAGPRRPAGSVSRYDPLDDRVMA